MISNKINNNSIDFDSGIPLKIQLRDIIRRKVSDKKIVDKNGKMETEFQLMERFSVSRVTVRSALKMLVDEGVIVRERGRGTFLRTNHPENWVGRLMGFTETIKESGLEPGAEILKKGITNDLDNITQENLNINEAWELKRLRFAGEEPIAIEHAYYPVQFGTYLENQELESIAIYKYFEEEVGIYLQDAKQVISAVNASEKDAKMLKVKTNEALLYIERITYSEDRRPIEFLKAVYRPSFFQYLIKLSRGG